MEQVIDLSAPSDFTPLEEILSAAGFSTGGPSPWGHSFWGRAGKCAYDGVMLRRHGFEPSARKALNQGILYHECLALRSLILTGRRPPVSYTSPAQAVCMWAEAHPSDWAVKLNGWALEVIDWVNAYDAHWEQPPPDAEPSIPLLQRCDFPAWTIGPIEFLLQADDPFPWSFRADKLVFMKTPHDAWSVLYPDLKTSSDAERLIRNYWQESQSFGAFYLWPRVRGTVHDGVQLPDYPMDYFALDILEKTSPPTLRREFFPNRPGRIALFEEAMKWSWDKFRAFLLHAEDVPDEEVHRVVPLEGVVNGNCFWGTRQECPRIDHCLRLVAAPEPVQVQVHSPTWDLSPTPPRAPSERSEPPPLEPVLSSVGEVGGKGEGRSLTLEETINILGAERPSEELRPSSLDPIGLMAFATTVGKEVEPDPVVTEEEEGGVAHSLVYCNLVDAITVMPDAVFYPWLHNNGIALTGDFAYQAGLERDKLEAVELLRAWDKEGRDLPDLPSPEGEGEGAREKEQAEAVEPPPHDVQEVEEKAGESGEGSFLAALLQRVETDPQARTWSDLAAYLKHATPAEIAGFAQAHQIPLGPEHEDPDKARDHLARVVLDRIGPQLPPPGQWLIDDYLQPDRGPIQLAQAIQELGVGAPVHVHGVICWITGRYQENSGRAILVSQRGSELAVPVEGPESLVMPIKIRRTDLQKPKAEEAAPAPAPTGIERGAVLDDVLTPTGKVPLYWLGSWAKGGKRLETMLQGYCEAADGREAVPEAFGVALVGRDEAKRRVQVKHVLDGVPQKATAQVLGEETWAIIARLVDEHVKGEGK